MHAAPTLQVPPRTAETTGHDPAEIVSLCAKSADPQGALSGVLRALAARKERFGKPAARAALEPLVTVCAGSRFLAQHLAARPRMIDLLACKRFVSEPGTPRLRTAGDPVKLAHKLRQQKQVRMLRIALRDYSLVPIAEITRELSQFAAKAFESAVRHHYQRLCAQHGPPAGRSLFGQTGFCVLGMGKLGGAELNFSSDVDVLYIYDKDGHTEGGLPHFAFYARLAEAVTAAIGSPNATPEGGFVFRVDLDLRPEGRSGPIVNAIRGLELYYEAQGAPWERFALLKARPIAGDFEVGEEALQRLAPFIFRKYFDLKAIDEMRTLKARAQKAAERVSGIDLKLGRGGIREVEFFCQALQLLHGGRDQNLRVRSTLLALDRLLFAGLISSRDRDELSEAYLLLRRLEHRVQMVAERQTHSIPDDEEEREKLAHRSGFEDAKTMLAELDLHRARVQARFSDLLRVANEEPQEDPRAMTAADPATPPLERINALRALGFQHPEASAEELQRLAKKRGTPFHDGQPFAAQLVSELSATPDPDLALRNLADLFGVLADARGSSEMLAHSPRTARLLLSLFGSSEYLSRQLLRHPELIDQLVHRGSAPLVRDAADLRNELRNRLKELDVEMQLEELRKFRSEEVLRIGLHDVAGALDQEQVSRQLSDLADACVEICLSLAREDVERRDGRSAASMVVIGLGKLGGRELGYHADLDLIFLYSEPGETEKHVSNHEHFARVGAKLISYLTLPLREGILYKIDTRLRPSGSAGPLCVAFDALATYHQREARLWERQALLRARPIAGDFGLFERARAKVLEPSLFRPMDRKAAASELLSMRERMQREIADESAGRYNSKLGRGGLVDVEFAVQFLQLVHGHDHPPVRTPSTPESLLQLTREGLLAERDFDALSRGYRFLRRLESRLRIVRDRSVDLVPEKRDELSRLARRMGYRGDAAADELLADYQQNSSDVRAAFLRVLGAG